MSLGPVMLDIAGTALSEDDRELLLHRHVGGVILFSRNFESIEQLHQLVREIHALREPRLLVSVDHEGGRVQRFRDGFSHIPPARLFGEIYEQDHHRARVLTRQAGWLMAIELRAMDIDFSFAPVLDLDYGVSDVIGNRAFHHKPEVVAELAHAWMQGMADAGMAATGKHFPGHGAVEVDSHKAVPIDSRDYQDIYHHDILPFRRMIGYGLTAIMPAHIIYDKVDRLPAGFSPVWLKQILRERLQFQGVIFSDDLDMEGASVAGERYSERARSALQAGCDMVLVCNNRDAAIEVLESLGDYEDPVAHLRLARMHGKGEMDRQQLHASGQWRQITEQLDKYSANPTLAFDF
ncbi:MAG: beta-N-acetylhexosaminidase [Thiohalophilus sp.]|uniref:beta-N-acetylhexosaminidase n=1 Tax=Thiohalophilus sp. TaxID=3028392 RepID=UPI0028709701|nr:beta-N-acetylhexosaminidase [Thiohalophilus sp.]MDR9436922.1 beta-N-acetylhexosaminidase [Thiohalophilus sp.]